MPPSGSSSWSSPWIETAREVCERVVLTSTAEFRGASRADRRTARPRLRSRPWHRHRHVAQSSSSPNSAVKPSRERAVAPVAMKKLPPALETSTIDGEARLSAALSLETRDEVVEHLGQFAILAVTSRTLAI